MEDKLQSQDIVGAFDILKHWYRKFSGKTLKTTPAELDSTRNNYVKLFTSDNFSYS